MADPKSKKSVKSLETRHLGIFNVSFFPFLTNLKPKLKNEICESSMVDRK